MADSGARQAREGRRYSDDAAAALSGALNPRGPSDDFHLAMVMGATSALGIGCATGALLRRAGRAGNAGRCAGAIRIG